jgi:hypothetical protein
MPKAVVASPGGIRQTSVLSDLEPSTGFLTDLVQLVLQRIDLPPYLSSFWL